MKKMLKMHALLQVAKNNCEDTQGMLHSEGSNAAKKIYMKKIMYIKFYFF